MKISVYGAGNQALYVDQLNLPGTYGGTAPYGGSRMAIEYAQAGHDVMLAEPDRSMLTEEHWKIVEDAGVKVTADDVEAAKHAEIAVLFTPFGKKTFDIAKTIVANIPQDGVIVNTCTVAPVVLYYVLEKELRRDRKDVGIASFHPAAVPGTPQHGHYVIGGKSTRGNDIATDAQIQKLSTLSQDCGKTPYIVPADASSAIADMGSLVTAVTLSGVMDYFYVGTQIIKAPVDMVEKQILMTLQTIASLVETSGVDGMLKAINPEILVKSAKSMNLMGDKQPELTAALQSLSDLGDDGQEGKFDLNKWIANANVEPTSLVAAQALAVELQNLMGGAAAEGTIRRCMRKMFD